MKPEILTSIDRSVLCWLATATPTGEANVSPKEIFDTYEEQFIIIANIASPNSIKNIQLNNKVCVSFIDVFVQKGFQVKGAAQIMDKQSTEYAKMEAKLLKITQGKFPFKSITKIEVEHTKPIIAPKYLLYPETTEKDQIKSAMKSYGII